MKEALASSQPSQLGCPIIDMGVSVRAAALLVAAMPTTTAITADATVFGKYFSLDAGGSPSTVDQSYYLFLPTVPPADGGASYPVVLSYHPGGFTGGAPSGDCDADVCASLLDRGIAFASMGYRLDGARYYFCPDGSTACAAADRREAEFIHVREDGGFALDAARTLASYEVAVGRQEFNGQAAYDAAAGFEHLLAHPKIDAHKVGLTGSSAGGAALNYLAWVWHALPGNGARATPRALVYTMAQLNYPVENTLDVEWRVWADDLGYDAKLADIVDLEDCYAIVGNPCCGGDMICQGAAVNLCNMTWHNATVARYCTADAYATATVGDLVETQVWPTETAQQRGLAKLWYAQRNMAGAAAHYNLTATPFYVYVANRLNGTVHMEVVHHAVAARAYAKAAAAAGLRYVSYYTDYAHMTADDAGDARFAVGSDVYNYKSNWDFVARTGVAPLGRVSVAEQIATFCFAFEQTCHNRTAL